MPTGVFYVFGRWVGLVGLVKASWGLLIEEGTPLCLAFQARRGVVSWYDNNIIKKPLHLTFQAREGQEQLNLKGWVSKIVKKEKSKGIEVLAVQIGLFYHTYRVFHKTLPLHLSEILFTFVWYMSEFWQKVTFEAKFGLKHHNLTSVKYIQIEFHETERAKFYEKPCNTQQGISDSFYNRVDGGLGYMSLKNTEHQRNVCHTIVLYNGLLCGVIVKTKLFATLEL
jgi:hypothetical protein